jgi:hypothetical protein
MIGRRYRKGYTSYIPWVREKIVVRIAPIHAAAIMNSRRTSSFSLEICSILWSTKKYPVDFVSIL